MNTFSSVYPFCRSQKNNNFSQQRKNLLHRRVTLHKLVATLKKVFNHSDKNTLKEIEIITRTKIAIKAFFFSITKY